MKYIKKILLSPWTALFTLALVLFIRSQDPAFLQSIRLRYFDTLITSKQVHQSESISVVNIDDETIRQFGQFPFPRDKYAQIIENLFKHNAGLVVFNIYMPDADRFGKDKEFANRMSDQVFPVVFPQMAGTSKSSYEPFRPGVSEIGDSATDYTIDYEAIEPNIKEINNVAKAIGVANVLPEIDGVVRRVPMVVSSGGKLYPSIGLETLRLASGDSSFQVKSNAGIEALRIPSYGKITTDSIGRIWVDWSSKPNEFSYSKLSEDFKQSIVIVGVTAKGLNNPIATAVGEQFPHYLQASVLDTLISGTNISRPVWADGAEMLFSVVIVIVSLFMMRFMIAGYVFPLVTIAGIYYGSKYYFIKESLLFDAIFPISALLLCFMHAYVVKFISEWHQKQQVKKQFGTYLSPALVEKLQKNPDLLKLGGESKELSIMFTDVRGFTAISEHYGADVQGLTSIMNRYMTAMTEKIIENNGTLDKYIGDAQMAFWNAPLDDPRHAKNAVKTAIQMMESLDEFNRQIEFEGIPVFGMGLGINTGTVVVGNMGSVQRFDYTCLGDSVNLASRLEGQSKPYGVRIILGPITAEQVKDEFKVIELDCIAVKGKKLGVKIFTLGEEPMQEKFLSEYYLGNWDEAILIAEKAVNTNKELKKYYEAMLDRMKEGKPSDWNGTYKATSK